MEKIKISIIICFMILGLASMGIAADATGTGGTIDLDGTGNMAAVAISVKGFALYTSDPGAGALGAGGTAGEQYCVVTGSSAGTPGIHLDFLMRGSQSQQDNNLYQNLTGSLPATPAALSGTDSNPATDAGWVIRGGS